MTNSVATMLRRNHEAKVEAEIVDRDAIEIGEIYEQARLSIVDSVRYQIECGERLAKKKNEIGHGMWLQWLATNASVLGFESDRTARRLIKVAATNRTLTSDLDTSTALAISRKTWGNTKEESQLIQQSLSNEHYTPSKYIDEARAVLGEIDLDPASCAEANEIVKATRFFALQDDGLKQPWQGRVWLNPPYGGMAGLFVAKLAETFAAGEVTQAIVLVNAHCTDTDWFQPLWDGYLCFTNHRLNFYGDESRSGSTHGSVFVYFGPNDAQFAKRFSQFGPVVARVPI